MSRVKITSLPSIVYGIIAFYLGQIWQIFLPYTFYLFNFLPIWISRANEQKIKLRDIYGDIVEHKLAHACYYDPRTEALTDITMPILWFFKNSDNDLELFARFISHFTTKNEIIFVFDNEKINCKYVLNIQESTISGEDLIFNTIDFPTK
ncbi:MAG: hypothetical protein KAS12_01625 [Candidatus Aenigmarchaeota archaeon]|nr:hypothetical protein [Candidatus Aenigmarchaeota archaeon]